MKETPIQTIYTPDELVDECFAWYMALEPGREAVTLNRQGFYQVVTAADFWKAVERLGL